jgi:cyanophycinase
MEGRLIAIGGAEDKTADMAVLQEVVRAAAETAGRAPGTLEIAVLATASRVPDQVLPDYTRAFRALGVGQVHALAMPDRAAARNAGALAAIRRSAAVFLTGGDQSRLAAVLGGTEALDAILTNYAQGRVVAGTSAGAAAMSSAMIAGGSALDALTGDGVRMSAGLGLLEGIVFDTHFPERGRFTRLMAVLAGNPGLLGVGLGENAGIVVHDATLLRAIGPGHTMILDGHGLTYANVAELAPGEPIALHGLQLHALTAGYGYDTYARAFLDPARLSAALGAADGATPDVESPDAESRDVEPRTRRA